MLRAVRGWRVALVALTVMTAACRSTGAAPAGQAPASTGDGPTSAADVTTTLPVVTTTSVLSTTATATTVPTDPYRTPGWVAAENARPGTADWRITVDEPAGTIEGYLDTTSVQRDGTVHLYVASPAATWHAEVYRMGWYHGAGGRLVWQSAELPSHDQPFAQVDAATGLAEAHWNRSLDLVAGPDWPPGDYLVKLVSSRQGAHYVPLTVRDDGASAAVLLVNAVATWQAYNPWGACSAYECPFLKSRRRADLVSFDRPYAHAYKKGAADFIDHEWPLVSLVEELGIDAAYATSIDLHEHPTIALEAKAVLSLGHDEYYTKAMRTALVEARDRGVNLAFFGANAIYRQIRLQPSSDGRPDRVEANYRTVDDPGAADDPTLATVEYRALGLAEHAIVGIGYVCTGVNAPMVVSDASSWVYTGLDVHDGQSFRNLVGNEADRADTRLGSPDNLQVLATSPLHCSNGKSDTAHMAYYSAPSGAGVFATGTIWWVCALDGVLCSWPENVPFVRGVTANVLRAFVAGPAGTVHPSGPASKG